MVLPDIESVLDEAGKLLYVHRLDLRGIPISTKSPSELLVLTRRTEVVEDYMPAKLPFYAKWLARWLACCLPMDEKLRNELLRDIANWARS